MRRVPKANIEQTLVTFRSFFTTSIDRGIEIGRIDVEKSMWSAKGKSTARQQNFVRAPKITMRRFLYANSTQTLRNFQPFLITSIDRSVHIDRIGVEKASFDSVAKSTQTIRKLFGPRKSRCVDLFGKYYANAMEFAIVLEHLDRSKR